MARTLLSPIDVGPLRLRNRVVSTSHQTSLVHDHLPTDELLTYHEARARGRVGTIVLEATAVHSSGLLTPHTISGFLPDIVGRQTETGFARNPLYAILHEAMFDDLAALQPLREAASLLAQRDWPHLYDPDVLARGSPMTTTTTACGSRASGSSAGCSISRATAPDRPRAPSRAVTYHLAREI